MPGRRVPARILERGRVTIPKDVRDDLGLEAGDRVWLTVEPVGDAENPYSHADAVSKLQRE